jgi:cellobiose-specific phosphotransferase system component IIC
MIPCRDVALRLIPLVLGGSLVVLGYGIWGAEKSPTCRLVSGVRWEQLISEAGQASMRIFTCLPSLHKAVYKSLATNA